MATQVANGTNRFGKYLEFTGWVFCMPLHVSRQILSYQWLKIMDHDHNKKDVPELKLQAMRTDTIKHPPV